jgi:hypothetical protein
MRRSRLRSSFVELPPPVAVVDCSGCARFDYKSVRVWIRNGTVDQVGVSAGYAGMLDQVLGVGSTIADVEAHFGEVVEDDDDCLATVSRPGWCFETEEWTKGHELAQNRDARITEVFVFGRGAGEQADAADDVRAGDENRDARS